ncbi:hypothetical protein [Actinoplanes hulinensis]|nr:hypothetical protein [Actinoplanes hulinensis]
MSPAGPSTAALLLAQPYSINNDHLITLGALAVRDDLDLHVGNHG